MDNLAKANMDSDQNKYSFVHWPMLQSSQVDEPTLCNILITISSLLIQGVLKIRKRFLNFAPLPSASQQWAPFLSKKIIEIGLLFIEISCL